MADLTDLFGGGGADPLAADSADAGGGNDLMSMLLLSQLGGATAPSPEAAMIGAVQKSPFLQGVPSQSGPMGQIGQALTAVLAPLAAAKQAEQAQAAQGAQLMFKLKQLQQASQAAALNEQYKKAQIAEMQRKASDPYGTLPGSVRAEMAAQAGVPGVSEALNSQEQRRASALAQQMGMQVNMAEQKRLMQPAKAPGGGVYFNATTMERQPSTLKQADVEAGDWVGLSRPEVDFLRVVKPAFDQLEKLKRISRKLLPTSTGNPLSDLAAVQANQAMLAGLRAAGDEDVKLFDAYNGLIVVPLTKAAQGTRINTQAMDLIMKAGPTTGDTSGSAIAKINNHEGYLIDQLSQLGFSPDAIREKLLGSGSKAASPAYFDIQVPDNLIAPAQALVSRLQAQGADDDAIAKAVRQLLRSQGTR